MDVNELMTMIRSGEGEELEFKRDVADIGKTVAAFANTYGGTILVGVGDQGEMVGIHGKGALQKISDSFASVAPPPRVRVSTIAIGNKLTIAAIKVERGQHLYSHKNIVYIRAGRNNRPLSIHEVVAKAGEGLHLFFDELVNNAHISDIDAGIVRLYIEQREAARGVRAPSRIDNKLFLQLRILKRHNGRIGVTNGGLLFFGKNSSQTINTARIHLICFSDDQMQHYADQKIFEGSLWKIVQEVEEYLRRTIRRPGGGLAGFKRKEKFEYPIDALREAVLNAVVHRNYFDAGDVKVFLLPDCLIIKNPGSFPPGVTPETPEHRPRNPLLSQYFYDVGLIEKYGSGIEKMRAACKAAGVLLSFDLRSMSATVIFKKPESKFEPDKMDKVILQKLGAAPSTAVELASLLKMTRQAVIKRLNRLSKLDLIQREGGGASVLYRLK